jgi:hypothetical protein
LKKLLKRNPNFNIGKDGTILYKGKNIDKILVNGKETFENQNSIALDNIKANMLSGLQIVNDYRDPFNMSENEFETVLNLKSKNPSVSVTTGDMELAYGIEKKYNIEGDLMRFSPSLNGFIINNTNNINEHTMSLRELTNLFNVNMPISSYMIDGLNNLFVDKSVYKKNISNTNFTLRGTWNKRIRLNTSCYYISNSYGQSSHQKEKDENGNNLYESEKVYNYRSNSFLLSTDFSYKISSSIFLNYMLRTIYTKPNYQYQDEYSELYQSTPSNGTLAIGDSQYNFGTYNQLNIQSKLSPKNILDLNFVCNQEKDKVSQDLNLSNESTDYIPLLSSHYNKTNNATSAKWIYSLTKKTKVFLSDEFLYTKEQLRDTTLRRKITSNTTTIGINGVRISNKLSYLAQFSLLIREDNNEFEKGMNSINHTLLPYNINFTYENRLNRLSFINSLTYNDINFKYAYTNLNEGANMYLYNQDLFNKVTSKLNFTIKYDYTNIFKGKNFGMAFKIDCYKNRPVDTFIGLTSKGINIYKPVLAERYISYNPSINYSFTMFPMSVFPVILSANYNFTANNILDYEDKISSTWNDLDIAFSSISKKHVNFSTEIGYNASKEKISDYKISYHSFSITPCIKYTSKLLYSELSYSFIKKDIYNSHINQHLNLKAGVDISKFQFNIIGQNIEHALKLSKNSNLDEDISVQNGIINYSSTKDIISYLLFQVKYKL